MRIIEELVEIWPNEVCDTFIDFVNFYHCFIQDFLTIARPLFDLTCSNKTWNWDTKEQEAVEHLKIAVTTAPVLALPQDSEPFHIEADSLDFASRAVLSQQLPREEKWHPVAFYSKSLSLVEQNYEIHDKEMLAIICAVMPLENFLQKCSMGYTLYPWISLLESTLETSYKPQP